MRTLPFGRININHFMIKVGAAEEAAGDEGFVTLETLRYELHTPAWEDLQDESSVLSKFLLSPAFHKEGL